MDRRLALAVAVGGAAGAGSRWAIVEAVGETTGWPWAIFAANVVGSFLLGLLVGAFPVTRSATPFLAGAATGFCGALTTFSSFVLDLALFLRDDRVALAIGYLVVSLGVGLVAYAAGRAAPGFAR